MSKVPGRPTTLVYGRARACSRCGMGGLFVFSSSLSYLSFLMPQLLEDGWIY